MGLAVTGEEAVEEEEEEEEELQVEADDTERIRDGRQPEGVELAAPQV